MSQQSFAAAVNYHTWQLARLRVPSAQTEHRLEATALAAATNILTELGINLEKSPARTRTKPTLYALVGWNARGPHDPSSSPRRIIAVLRDNKWKDGKRYPISDFMCGAEDHGWVHVETADISQHSEPVRMARAKGFLTETSTENYFQMMLFTRDQYH